MCNQFDHFITLTLDGNKYDRHDLDLYIKDLGQFIRNYRRIHKVDIQYLLIPEQHKNGAWHIHGLIRGIPLEHLEVNKFNYLDWPKYREKFGWCSMSAVKSQIAVSKYITKYISKNLLVMAQLAGMKNKKLYYATRGLKKPQKIKEGTTSANVIPHDIITFENDYVITVEMNFNQFYDLLGKL